MIITKGVLEVKHSISTRIRFKVFSIRKNKVEADKIEKFISELPGIKNCTTNIKSASIIVRFNPLEISRKNLIESIKEYPGFIKKKAFEPEERQTRYYLKRFTVLTGVTAAVFIKESILGLSVAQGLFSPLGIITTIAALPLFKTTITQIRERKLTLESFLGGSIIAATAAGEAAAALEILWITSAGELLQSWITERSRKSIREIVDVTSKNTFLLVDGVEVEVPVEQVEIGDVVVLHTGEKICVDGEIIRGEGLVDEAPISGRAEHILKREGQRVYAGTYVMQGVIFVKAEHVGDDTYLSRIFTMVESSMENKAPIESVADRLAENLIKTGFAVTLGTYLITGSLWRAFTVMLVMACPCATILSASTAISAAISAAAKKHILIKGGKYLEETGKVDVVCFDKTGTLTTNEPVLSKIINYSDEIDDDVIRLVYSAEVHNFHPIALAVKKEAEKRGIEPIVHDVCEYILGRGIRAVIQDREILVGSMAMMKKFGVDTEIAQDDVADFRQKGLTTIFISDNNELAGIIGFENQEREGIKEIIDYLTNNGISETIMITGDEECTAQRLASKLNIEKCYHSVMPEDKADIVNGLKKGNHRVLMVGDGINDALALAEGDIGIAMGAGGSEVAIEAADIALVGDDLEGIVYVYSLSKETLKVVHQNFWIATGSNILGVILGASGLLTPVAAGLIHITHTLGILANSSRLLKYEPENFLLEDKK